MDNIPYGYCHCGCGAKTNLATSSSTVSGAVKGEPNRFIYGHQRRKSPVAFRVLDKGFHTACWVWQRYKDTRGYGRLTINGKQHRAHRHYFERKYGPVPEGLVLHHMCENPSCVNPDHLAATTQAYNVRIGGTARLNEEDVHAIRALAATGRFTYEQIGQLFTLARGNVSMIVRNRSWREV